MDVYVGVHDLTHVGNKVTEVIADAYQTLLDSQAARDLVGEARPPTVVIVPSSDPDRVWISWLFAPHGAEIVPVDFGSGHYRDGEVVYQLNVPIVIDEVD